MGYCTPTLQSGTSICPYETTRDRHRGPAVSRSRSSTASQDSSFPGFRVAPARCCGSGAAALTPGAARGGPPLSRSVRLRGTRGRGMATPMGPAPHDTSDESGGARGWSRSEAVGAARTAREYLEIWKPENLRGCGARQVFRFSGFQVLTQGITRGLTVAAGAGIDRPSDSRKSGRSARFRAVRAATWRTENLELGNLRGAARGGSTQARRCPECPRGAHSGGGHGLPHGPGARVP